MISSAFQTFIQLCPIKKLLKGLLKSIFDSIEQYDVFQIEQAHLWAYKLQDAQGKKLTSFEAEKLTR